MTKAQEVRQKRLNSIKADRDEALKIIEWILDELDKRTARKDYSPLEVIYSGYCIATNDGDEYRVNINPSYAEAVFNFIKDFFDGEEGYSAEILEKPENDRRPRLSIVIE